MSTPRVFGRCRQLSQNKFFDPISNSYIRFGVVDLFHGIHGIQSVDTGIWWVALLFPGIFGGR